MHAIPARPTGMYLGFVGNKKACLPLQGQPLVVKKHSRCFFMSKIQYDVTYIF